MDTHVCQICYEVGAERRLCGHFAHTRCLEEPAAPYVTDECRGEPNPWDGCQKVRQLSLATKLVELNGRDLVAELEYAKNEVRHIIEGTSESDSCYRVDQAMVCVVGLKRVIYGKHKELEAVSFLKTDKFLNGVAKWEKRVELATEGDKSIAVALAGHLPLSVAAYYLFPMWIVKAWAASLEYDKVETRIVALIPYTKSTTSYVKKKGAMTINECWVIMLMSQVDTVKLTLEYRHLVVQMPRYSIKLRLPTHFACAAGNVYILAAQMKDTVAILYGYLATEHDLNEYPRILNYEDNVALCGCVIGYLPSEI